MIRALRAIGLMAIHCDIQDDSIKVGILIADPEVFEPGHYTLVDVDKDEQEILSVYPVTVPDLNSPANYNLTLKRYAA